MCARITLAALLAVTTACSALDEPPPRRGRADGATLVPDLGPGPGSSEATSEQADDASISTSPDSRARDSAVAFVKIVSPADKASVKNPVSFTVSAGQVSTVKLSADGWPLADPFSPATKTSVSYTFIGLNYLRLIRLEGRDSKGATVAVHEIHITVTN